MPNYTRIDPEVRFFRLCHEEGDCWIWNRPSPQHGYGTFWDGERNVRAHRWAYEFMVGEIPEGLSLDHLCRNPACVNPYHLDPVPHVVNCWRGDRKLKPPTHCKRGHDLSVYGYSQPARPTQRRCNECKRVRQNERSEERTGVSVEERPWKRKTPILEEGADALLDLAKG